MKTLRFSALAIAAMLAASPAAAQWTRVAEVPVTNIYSVWANGDTIACGADSVAYVSTNAGATWTPSAPVAPGVVSVQAVRVRNGRVYAGTYGHGVFVSDNMGGTWQPFNQGLSGGIANSHLAIAELLVDGDYLYAATAGAGAYRRNLAVPGNWVHYGDAFEPNQSSNMNGIAAGGARLLAAAGANGTVFFRDAAAADWTLSWLNNVGIVPGLAALSAIWTGDTWLVGSNIGVFRSTTGQSPWTFVNVGHGTLFIAAFATRGPTVFACFGVGLGTSIEYSHDDGATWHVLDDQPQTFTFNIAVTGSQLYAARFDGLWRRSIANVGVPSERAPGSLRLTMLGPNPVRGDVRLRLELPEAGPVAVEVFDIAGRRVANVLNETLPAGAHDLRWHAHEQAAGVYLARVRAGGSAEVVRVVRAE